MPSCSENKQSKQPSADSLPESAPLEQSSCGSQGDSTQANAASEHCHPSSRADWLLLGSGAFVALFYALHLASPMPDIFPQAVSQLGREVYDLVNTMWWGVVLGILMIAVLAKIPREFVMSALGTNRGTAGIMRASVAGVLLDLCSHGILMVASKLYERGASVGQVMAFLVASPWNSFSLTLVLVAMIGLQWTLLFVLASMLVAIAAGMMFDLLVSRGVLPDNPNQQDLDPAFRFWPSAKAGLRATSYSRKFFTSMLWQGLRDSRMVMRWLLFGIVLASLVRVFMPPDAYGEYFGPTMLGLAMTVVVATVMEVCSEGSAPIAADLVTRAAAPGNGFAFLMTGVSTDYTEIMVLRDTTGSWKTALFLPLLTVPQVLLIAWLMNAV